MPRFHENAANVAILSQNRKLFEEKVTILEKLSSYCLHIWLLQQQTLLSLIFLVIILIYIINNCGAKIASPLDAAKLFASTRLVKVQFSCFIGDSLFATLVKKKGAEPLCCRISVSPNTCIITTAKPTPQRCKHSLSTVE